MTPSSRAASLILCLIAGACRVGGGRSEDRGGAPDPAVHRVGAEARPLGFVLERGRLVITDLRGAELYVSRPDEHIYDYAIAPISQQREPVVLLWLARRDANTHGVVPHDSGWMDYGETPWIHMHLAVLGLAGDEMRPRWVSSALAAPIESIAIERDRAGSPASIVAVQRELAGRQRVRYRFRGWTLEVVDRASLPEGAPRAPVTGLADLAVVGDIMLARTVGDRLSVAGYQRALGGIAPRLRSADLAIGNLESCFGRQGQPGAPTNSAAAGRNRPHPDPMVFFAPPEHVGALAFLGIDTVNLANNHCSGDAARRSRELLADTGISAVGTGAHGLDREPRTIAINGVAIGIMGGMIWPTTARRLRRAMTAGNAARLRRAAAEVDFLLVTLHWGKEYASEPSRGQRRLGRWLIDQGVDAVIGHHPHVVQPIERYRDGLIAYSLGNFIFDQEGYIPEAEGRTERGLLLQFRVHSALGWTVQETATCIAERHIVTPCAG